MGKFWNWFRNLFYPVTTVQSVDWYALQQEAQDEMWKNIKFTPFTSEDFEPLQGYYDDSLFAKKRAKKKTIKKPDKKAAKQAKTGTKKAAKKNLKKKG